jgi:hypothetical protein
VLLNLENVLSGNSFAYGSSDEERIEWSSFPSSIHLLNPFILTVLTDSSIEIHDLASLLSLQRISIASPAPHIISLTICADESNSGNSPSGAGGGGGSGKSSSLLSSSSTTAAGGGPSFAYHVYVSNGEQISVLKMIPLSTQVDHLINGQQYEQAINLCKICSNTELLAGINLIGLYESSAHAMLMKGDYEKAINHFIMAKTDFVEVARNFPDLIPLPLHFVYNVSQVRNDNTFCCFFLLTCFTLCRGWLFLSLSLSFFLFLSLSIPSCCLL